MNREILNDYKEKDDKILLAHVLDKIEMCEKRNKIEYTDFLDLAQIELVQKFINKIRIENYMSFGGFEQAERKIFVIYPEKFNSSIVKKNLSNIIQIVRIELPEDLKGRYTHRDYLGAVIKLGVKREKVGDIIVDNDGADIIVDKDISKFLVENLGGLTRFSKSTISVQSIENLRPVEIKKEEREIIVSSLERVNDKEKVLSFIDKYDNYSLTDTHIIPADIDNKIAKKIIYNAKMVYQKLNLKSIVRFDYLLDYERNEFYLNEVNAIPGSLSYYLFENKDIKMVDLVDLLYKAYRENKKEDLKKLHQYNQTLNSLKEK